MTNWEYKGNNTAYLDFVDREEAYIEYSVPIRGTGLILDFDEDDVLVGIETYHASSDLPEEVKNQLENF